MRAAALALACSLACSPWTTGSSGDDPTDDPNRSDPCADDPTYIDCGSTGCGTTAECAAGQHCATELEQCVAECIPGDDSCGAGAMCTPHGRCAYTEANEDADVCAAAVAEATFTIPTVVLLVDRSGSMRDPYPSGSRWSVLRDALVDPTDGVVARLETSVRFGLTLYSGGSNCPVLRTEPPSLDNYQDVYDLFHANSPGGDTPTGESIDVVLDGLIPYAEPGPKYIVLATDGEPDTCARPSDEEGQPEAIAAAQRSTASGIDLFILSVGQGDVSLEHLQDMANAGVGLPVDGSLGDAPFYEPNDQAELAAAFDSIIGMVLSCVLTVDGSIPSSNPTAGVVTLDGDEVRFGDPNGWEYANPTTIRLVGASCDKVKAGGDHVVTIEIPCYEPPV